MQETNQWLAQMYRRWTTLSDDDSLTRDAPFNEEEVAELAAVTSDDSVIAQFSGASTGKSKYHPKPAKPSSPITQVSAEHVEVWDSGSAMRHAPRGIHRKNTKKYPENQNATQEGFAPLKDSWNNGVPAGAKWTKITRVLVNPEALEEAHERFEDRDDHVVILRALSREEIVKLAERTQDIRVKCSGTARLGRYTHIGCRSSSGAIGHPASGNAQARWIKYRPPSVEDEDSPMLRP